MSRSSTTRPRPASRVVLALSAMALIALVSVPVTLAAPGDVDITLASDTTWTASDADPGVGPDLGLPGAAQFVCLNDTNPTPCPSGATTYGWPGGGWGADLGSIPGAGWIWAPGIDGSTSPADVDTYRFTKTITVPGTPVAGSFAVGADDSAEVWVNGTKAGDASSPASLATFDITALLAEGANTIVVIGTNGLICGRVCTYAENPAGVAFGGSITYTPAPAPTASPSGAPAGATPGRTVAPTPPPTSTDVVPSDGATGDPIAWALLGTVAAAFTISVIRRPVRRSR